MKNINVNIFACHGFGCCGGSYSSEEAIDIEVSDEAAVVIRRLLEECKNSEDGLNEEVFLNAIEAGHDELKPVLEAIDDKHSDMVARYWLFEDYNEFIDESLRPHFWEDIKNGLYTPESSFEEYMEEYKEEEGTYDEEEVRDDYYDENRDKYLEWVNSNEDYWFIAERVGLELDVVYSDKPELEFVISEVK